MSGTRTGEQIASRSGRDICSARDTIEKSRMKTNIRPELSMAKIRVHCPENYFIFFNRFFAWTLPPLAAWARYCFAIMEFCSTPIS